MTESSNPELVRLIVEEIRKRGPISFRDFMEMSLYYPELGYYTSPGEKIGKEGDYYTGPHLTPLFGEMLGRQISEIGKILGGKGLNIVEMGAGKGLMASDVLNFLKMYDRAFYDSIQYHVIEVSNWLNERQRDVLEGHGAIWHDSLDNLRSGINGVFISNELVDSFPVHLVVMEDSGLKEIFIDWSEGSCGVDGRFVETVKDLSDSILEGYFEELGVLLQEGYRTEVNLDALKWIERIGEILERGFVITIDYGYPSGELYQPYRSRGTLLCYYRHATSEDPYIRIGYQDITSHVNFSALIHRGRRKGLEFTGFTDQARFFINLGIEDYLKGLITECSDYSNYLRKMLPVKNLLLPGMGETFKVLIQHKGMEGPSLRGLVPH